jgi:hypothetical protein
MYGSNLLALLLDSLNPYAPLIINYSVSLCMLYIPCLHKAQHLYLLRFILHPVDVVVTLSTEASLSFQLRTLEDHRILEAVASKMVFSGSWKCP